jgi:hypothetical protein
MDFIQSLKDSIETSVKLKLFSSRKAATTAHMSNTEFMRFTMSAARKLDNFNPDRLSKNPYPAHDRPRGDNDLISVRYHRKQIRDEGEVEPVWIAKQKGRYILLDGAHRLVATYLEGKRTVPAYIVHV